jgi:hypothetical protein
MLGYLLTEAILPQLDRRGITTKIILSLLPYPLPIKRNKRGVNTSTQKGEKTKGKQIKNYLKN